MKSCRTLCDKTIVHDVNFKNLISIRKPQKNLPNPTSSITVNRQTGLEIQNNYQKRSSNSEMTSIKRRKKNLVVIDSSSDSSDSIHSVAHHSSLKKRNIISSSPSSPVKEIENPMINQEDHGDSLWFPYPSSLPSASHFSSSQERIKESKLQKQKPRLSIASSSSSCSYNTATFNNSNTKAKSKKVGLNLIEKSKLQNEKDSLEPKANSRTIKKTIKPPPTKTKTTKTLSQLQFSSDSEQDDFTPVSSQQQRQKQYRFNSSAPSSQSIPASVTKKLDVDFAPASSQSTTTTRSLVKPPIFKLKSSLSRQTSSDNILKKDINDTQLWIDKYMPQREDDLAIHKKKIADVKNWLTTAIQRRKPCILLLVGPSGSGKTAVIRALSHTMKFDILEWINPIHEHTPTTYQEDLYNNMIPTSISTQFKEFLIRSASSSTLSTTNQPISNHHNFISSQSHSQHQAENQSTQQPQLKQKQRIILMEDVPNVCQFQVRQGVHEAIRNYLYSPRSKHPIVIILSDIPLHQESKRDHDEIVSARLLLPPDIYCSPQYTTEIKFNPVAPTIVTKALERVMKEQFRSKSEAKRKAFAKKIAICCEGDLRWAINTLQFMHLDMSFSFMDDEEELIHSSLGRDHSALLFSALGKVLYSKRDEETIPCSLPGFLQEKVRIRPPSFIPEHVIDRVPLERTTVNLYLHQNYLEFFQDIDQVVDAAEYTSDADILSSSWGNQRILSEYSSSVMSRGLLFSNTDPKSSSYVRYLFKPNLWKQQAQARECLHNLKHKLWYDWYKRWTMHMNKHTLLDPTQDFYFPSPSSKYSLLMDSLPYTLLMTRRNNPMITISDCQWIVKISGLKPHGLTRTEILQKDEYEFVDETEQNSQTQFADHLRLDVASVTSIAAMTASTNNNTHVESIGNEEEQIEDFSD